MFVATTYSQTNLVPNPSFEIYDTCPNTLSQISRAVGWHSARPSPDYFNSCTSSSSQNWVPVNFIGHQNPASGSAYAGFSARYGGVSTGRELVGASLTNPLQIGTKYYLSFKVSKADIIDCSVNKLGALFSTVDYTDNNNAPICNCAQIYSDSIITDTVSWTRIKGSFIADSNYSYINIGNFFTDAASDSVTQSPTCNAYYYLDDICVSTDSLYTAGWQWTTGVNNFSNEENILLFPNPSTDGFMYLNKNLTNENVVIYDMLGNNIKSFLINGNKIDLTDLQNGIYFIQISNNRSYFKQKIIINK
jgi:hypothetical protein